MQSRGMVRKAVVALALLVCTGSCARHPARNAVAPGELRDRLATSDLPSLARRLPRHDHPPGHDNLRLIARIPQPLDLAYDGPRYFLYMHEHEQQAWILIITGFTGTAQWHGPATPAELLALTAAPPE